ncbi:Arm DNA-binding domain-containing protein, partial [Algoriphagus sp.]
MLEKSFGLLFFLKQSKKNKNGEKYIYLRITVDGIPKELSTKRLWQLSKWNVSAGRAFGNSEEGKTLNSYLDTLYYKALQAKKQLLDRDQEVTAEAIKNILLGVSEKKKMIMEIFKEHNEQVEALLDKEFAPGTLQRYRTSYDHTKA